MKFIKNLKYTLAAMAMALCSSAFAGDGIDVVKIKYNDGLVDYIPVSEVDRISFAKGVDVDGAQFTSTSSMFDLMKAYMTVTGEHNDFGYPAIIIGLDSHTPYMTVGQDNGYDWFMAWRKYRYSNYGSPNIQLWGYCYSYISAANNIIKEYPATSADDERLLLAQSYALRSFAYWNLVQCFAHNYAFAPDAAALPLITEVNNAEAYSSPQPLATTAQIYEQIFSDINTAISLLSDNDLNPAYIDVAHAKRYVDLSVAYGLRARYNLTMHKYAEAAADARLAIDNSASSPLLYEVAGYPGFNNAKAGNWMWAITVDETDRVVTSGIVNYTSHISSLCENGYTSMGAYKACTDVIWSYLTENPSDVRLNWFADDDFHAPLLTKSQNNVIEQLSGVLHPNVKFDIYLSKLGGRDHACDVPLMRIEEMYLIEAEGLAMSGDVTRGRALLNAFIQTYRNPEFMCLSASADDIRKEIVRQRSIEFWGEGLSYFDMLRLQLDLDRTSTGVETLRIRGGSDFFKYPYPKLAPLVAGNDYDAVDEWPVPGEDWND